MIHVPGRMEQDSTRFHHTTQIHKMMNCLFLEFSISYFWTSGNWNWKAERQIAGLLYLQVVEESQSSELAHQMKNSKIATLGNLGNCKLKQWDTTTHLLELLKSKKTWASLVAQWLRICLPMQGTRVRALVWEDPTCRGAAGPVSHNYWACASGACAPQQKRPR